MEIGQQFGRLTILERDNSKPKGHGEPSYWICQCECGNKKSVRGSHLTGGKIVSCGCYQKERTSQANRKDLTGKQFGFLIAIKPLYANENRHILWECKCLNCGGVSIHDSDTLTQGKAISCGCIRSKGENKIKDILTILNIPFKQEVTFKDLRSNINGILRFDFAIYDKENLVALIEYQGIQHYKDNSFYEPLKYTKERDNLKKVYCDNNNIKLITIPYWDYNLLDENYLRRLIYD